ncbi:S8 family serine peptidase [Microbacterium sp. cx-55]|nr:S8 family serine peptidase [Microbacterium sp. cx-55]
MSMFAGAPALAASPADANWWYDAYGVDQVHAEGITGKGVKIAVIDAQINPDVPDLQGTDLTVSPESACATASPTDSSPTGDSIHGTTITAMLIGNGSGASGIRGIVPDASVTFYASGPTESDCAPRPEAEAADLSGNAWLMQKALDDGADIITTSIGGGKVGNADDLVVAQAIARQVPVIAAVPNDANEGGTTPWSFRGVVAANAVDANQQLLLNSLQVPNVSLDVTLAAPGGGLATLGTADGWDSTRTTSGASFAAPLIAGIFAAAKQKYPDATNNQLMQSLAHTTGGEAHPLEYSADSGYGYGIASLAGALSQDPRQYDDENIALGKGSEYPTDESIAAASATPGTPSSAPESTSLPAADPQENADAALGGAFVIGGVVVAVVIIFAIVLTIVLVRRSHRVNRRGQ